LARDRAYRIVQRHALKVARNGGNLREELLKDPQVRRHLSAREIEQIWDLKHYLKNVDSIFGRVFH
jgi:adenylosuccinate lyase